MCSYSSSAQTQQRRVPMMGGYSAADVNDPSVTKAAQFAVSSGAPNSKYTFALMDDTYWIRVIKAEQQVVAGKNYKLTIEISDENNTCLGVFDVVIYDRFGDLSVTNWGNEHPCGFFTIPNDSVRVQSCNPLESGN